MPRARQYCEGDENIDASFDPLPPIDPSAVLRIDGNCPTDVELELRGAQLDPRSFVLEDPRHP